MHLLARREMMMMILENKKTFPPNTDAEKNDATNIDVSLDITRQ